MNISMIFCALSLLFSMATMAALYLHGCKDDRRFDSMKVYIDEGDKQTRKRIDVRIEEVRQQINSVIDEVDLHDEERGKYLKQLNVEIHRAHERIDEALTDINPNFEAAKRAISQVSDLSSQLGNLFSYDPVTALRERRERGSE